jgi:Cu2+-exporting ATPase
MELREVKPLAEADEMQITALAAVLQRHASHPLARAFDALPTAPDVEDVVYESGRGLRAQYAGKELRLGSASFCRELCPGLPDAPAAALYWIALCHGSMALGWLGLSDQLRPEAEAVLRSLLNSGKTLELLTGDSSARAEALGRQLPFAAAHCGQSPQGKIDRVRALQDRGAVVAMIGDGLNDAPVLKLADCSIAVTGANDLARAQADIVLLRGDLWQIAAVLAMAQRTRRVMLQNFAWALGYNALGIPLAALGLVPPWAAALGMSASSLLVVLNSLRLRKG